MLGFGKKKEKPAEIANPESEQPKTPPYDVNNEVVFHVMPTRFKKQNADAKQAQKTGLLIMGAAAALIFLLLVVLAWYFLFSGKKAAVPTPTETAPTETATTTQAPTAQADPSLATATEPIIDMPAAPEAATSAPETASSSQATSTAATTESSQAAVVIASSTDSDNDGLTDPEEAILGTNKDKADTDGDGYSDLAEFAKGYNPNGAGKISSKILGSFQNNNFSIAYPATWQFTSSGNDSAIFRTADEQMIKVSLQPNIKNQTIVEWYKEQFGNKEIATSQYSSQVDLEGNYLWQGIYSPDRLTIYLTNGKMQTIASISYDLGFSGKLNYPELFSAMVNSFVLKN
jgi:Na+-transporting methylmalonyl-CoA/oxaloacetate decarboxylase gamma subunit